MIPNIKGRIIIFSIYDENTVEWLYQRDIAPPEVMRYLGWMKNDAENEIDDDVKDVDENNNDPTD